jgi:hypothetical protein
MSNLHFHHLLKGIIVDFLVAFNLNLVPNFIDIYIYPTWVVITTRGKYLAKKSDE